MPVSITAPYGALLLRLTLGVMFLAHGLLKVFVFTLPGTVKFFAMLGYPAALAYVVVGLEILGGLALLTGLFTRTVSLALVPVLVGALLVHLHNGWLFSAANGGWEFPALWIMLLLVQALVGPGAFALRLPGASRNSLAPSSI
ncbi:DoxX family protein [Methylocystis heyeri]|uniref:DoxX family membrane protein n=1 Tax=Methylocystis heyeri TaxID=391905 RepID=A0A6B8KAW7_9HYPH|nr:DoxX family protein [Methylocystis heyeri]QGM44817.1 DoxX family membrane protein [Methylocystis heyeri]